MGMLYLEPMNGESISLDEGGDSITELYVAVMESASDTKRDITRDKRTPKKGDRHPVYRSLVIKSVEIQQDKDIAEKWDLTVDYHVPPGPEESQAKEFDPSARISWGSVERQRITAVDFKGRPILNTAGDLVEDVVREYSNLTIRVEKDITKAPAWVLRYRSAVNSDSVRIDGLVFPPDTLKIRNLARTSLQKDDDLRFFTLSFDMEHEPEGWTARIINRGFNQLLERRVGMSRDTEKIKKRILIEGEYPSEPQFLDVTGKWINTAEFGQEGVVLDEDIDGQPIRREPRTPADIWILEKQLEPRLPFRVLPLK